MRTLIVYATKHGTTADCAGQLASKLDGESVLCRLGKDRLPPLDSFDRIVVGGSIHIGKIQKSITDFTVRHQDILLKKPLGLFICCMAEGETAEHYMETSFPAGIVAHASSKGLFGGSYRFSKMGWLNRKMIQMVEKQQAGHTISTSQDIDKTRPDAIVQFAAGMNGL